VPPGDFDLAAYDYDLPEALIAQRPAEPRDASRLLVLHRADGRLEHRTFADLPEYLDARDLIVANNTRVLRARLLGHRIGGETPAGGKPGRVEFVLLEELRPRVWEGLFHASAKYKPGLRFEVPTPDGRGLRGTLVRGSAESPHGTVVAEFDRDPVESGAGEVPLPKYIRRLGPGLRASGVSHVPFSDRERDERAYQTAYARHAGSAAAPTAGLHFTPELIERLRAKGVGWQEVTLHVGIGTFRPVKDSDIRKHAMHAEAYDVPEDAAEAVTQAKRERRRVTAVGTTSVRVLESAWREGGLQAGKGRTEIFLFPGGPPFQVVDRLITNFHLPRSSLLMLVAAFAGRELVLRAYREAVERGYRFYSYGDAMLVL
jgi:S-adenosylmethionine:tRNA ribosyltransferase-isomerase